MKGPLLRLLGNRFWTIGCFVCGVVAASGDSTVALHGAPPAPEPAWREPGQVFTPEYLASGQLRYAAADGDIVGFNRTAFNNRPLYGISEGRAVVRTGDRPLVRLLGRGTFAAGIVRDGRGPWWHEYAAVESRYRGGRMTWRMSDPSLPGVQVRLEAVPLSDREGFAVRVRAEGLKAGDRLVWMLGGPGSATRGDWDPVMRGNPHILRKGDPRKPALSHGLMPEWSAGNEVRIEGHRVRLRTGVTASHELVGGADRTGDLRVVDAAGAESPLRLIATAAEALPAAGGVIPLESGTTTIHWLFSSVKLGEAWAERDASTVFTESWAHQASSERLVAETPDPFLDAALAAVGHPIDALFHQPTSVFHHGTLAFNIPFLGWRVISGSTALGWHDRVAANAAVYFARQVIEAPDKERPDPDPVRLGTQQSAKSRFFGRGNIVTPYDMYDTQTQFFDQTIQAWRATADPVLERGLRPALERHLEWAKDCFDPDGDGLYESYINTLPSDSVWYNGGGSVEQSAYIFTAHLAARDLARRAGDAAAAARHQQSADHIQRALREKLWIRDRGHFGLYIDQEPPHRLHPDAWTLSQYLPIEAGLLTPIEAAQALHFTEWALERIRLPYGGSLAQLSNWVPSKWSVRDIFNGDVWALALAYAQTGLADEAWDLLRGALLESAYAGGMPGGFSHIGAGADFGDSVNMFPRAVVNGLFGYDPDYPNGTVSFRPALPTAWPSAALRTPDFSFRFHRENGSDRYTFSLTREAALELRLPVRAERVTRVTIDGADVPWTVEPGFGCTWLRVRTSPRRSAEVFIALERRVAVADPVVVTGEVNAPLSFAVAHGTLEGVADPQGGVAGVQTQGDRVSGRWGGRSGHVLLLADVRVGELPQRLTFKCRINDPGAAVRAAEQTPRQAPLAARWATVDLRAHFNGDVRTIFQQAYVSPRPDTVSLRLGTDGWSAWTFTHWGDKPPAIGLEALASLRDASGNVVTPQGARFAVMEETRNIAFTSRWDNWPRTCTVPIGQSAEMAWLLVAGSTFPMHFRMANAVFRFRYVDGVEERLDLVPPLNYWNLSSWGGVDYDSSVDAFALPTEPPPQVQLGQECRAMVLSWRLRRDVALESVTLETLSPEVVVGLMGLSLMNPGR
jgi:hypothetical protein